MNITQATIELEKILKREDCLSDEVLDVATEYLLNVWDIRSPVTRMHIIQIAAINVGLLRAEDLD